MSKKFRKVLSILLCAGMLCTVSPAVYAEDAAQPASAAAEASAYPNTSDDGHTHTGSKYAGTRRVEPTCTWPAMIQTLFICDKCGTEFPIIARADSDNPAPALGHDLVDPQLVESECGSYMIGHCRRCEMDNVTTGSPEHNWSPWETKEEATCAKTGTMERKCSKCNRTEQTEIPKLSTHTWGEWEETASDNCAVGGKKTRHCEVCNAEESVNVPAKNHKYQLITVEATCTKTGESYRQCTVCGYIDEESKITLAMKDHTPEAVDDCTEDIHCTVCGALVAEGQEAHDFSEEWSYDNEGHFRKCLNEGCTVVADSGKHTGEYIMGDCTMGFKKCDICGAKAVGKEASHNIEGSEVKYFTSEKHIYRCNNEGCVAGLTEAHTPADGRNDCTSPVICGKCGATIQDGQKNHNFGTTAFNRDYDEKTETGHIHHCLNKNCSGTKTTEHNYVSCGSNAEICAICHEIKIKTGKLESGSASLVSADEGEIRLDSGEEVSGDAVLNVVKDTSSDTYDQLEKENSKVKAAYDITITCGGVKVQPEGSVKVTVAVDGIADDSTVDVYYIPDIGDPVKMSAEYSDGFVSFITNHFSKYVIVENATINSNDPQTGNNEENDSQTGNNQENAPQTGNTVQNSGNTGYSPAVSVQKTNNTVPANDHDQYEDVSSAAGITDVSEEISDGSYTGNGAAFIVPILFIAVSAVFAGSKRKQK